MAKIRFEDGTVVNFSGEPTKKDIDDAAVQLKIAAPTPTEPGEGVMVKSFGENFMDILPTNKTQVEEKIRSVAQGAPAALQFGGGLVAGALTGQPTAGLKPRGILARQLVNAPPLLRSLMGQTNLAGAVGGVAGRAAGQELKLQAEAAPLRTVARTAPLLSPLTAPFAGLAGTPAQIETEKRMDALKDIGVTAGIEAGAFLGIEGVKQLSRTPMGKFVVKRVPDLMRGLGGIYRETVKQAKRIGSDRIKRVAGMVFEDPAGYFTQHIVPRVQTGIKKITSEVSDNVVGFLKESGISDKAVKTFKRTGVGNLRKAKQKFAGGLIEVADRIDEGLRFNFKRAGDVFETVFNRAEETAINVKNTLLSLQNDLVEIGALDELGNRTASQFDSPVVTRLLKVYDDMLQYTAPIRDTTTGKFSKKLFTDKTQYRRLLTRLKASVGGRSEKEFNRIVFKALGNIRKDAATAIPGLSTASHAYGKALKLLQDNLGKVTEQKLGKKTYSQGFTRLLKEIDDALPSGSKFLSELDNVKSADEILPLLDDFLDPVFIEKQLAAFGKFRSPGLSQLEKVKKLLSFLPDKEIADDTLAFFLVDDLFQEILPSGFGGAAGLSRTAFESMTRKLIKSATPATAGQVARRTATGRAVPTILTEMTPNRQ